MEPALQPKVRVPEVGDQTALVDSTRHPRIVTPRRRGGGLPWVLLALTLTGAGLGGWILWERGQLAEAAATGARQSLDDATARAAAAEGQVMAMSAERLRPAVAVTPPDLEAAAEAIRGAIDRAAGDVAIEDGKVVITLDDPDLFRTDDADLTRRGQAVVDAVAKAVAAGFSVWVHGHVDDAPMPEDAQFDSAWELSSARALAVLHRFEQDGVETRRLAAIAFGADRPAGADRAKNRRIEIVLEPLAASPVAARTAPAR